MPDHRRRTAGGGGRKTGLFTSIFDKVDTNDLSATFKRVSIGTTVKELQVPPLSAYSSRHSGSRRDDNEDEIVPPTIPKAGPIPCSFSSTDRYLESMMAHTQQEFEASLTNAVGSISRAEGGGWFRAMCAEDRQENSLHFVVFSPIVDGQPSHDFNKEPWSRHAVQFEGFSVPAIVTVCSTEGSVASSAKIVARSPNGHAAVPRKSVHLSTRVRSLGYVGCFLREYDSIAGLCSGSIHSNLLPVVASPSRIITEPNGSGFAGGTFVSSYSVSLDTSKVPLNGAQKNAVQNLRGGLDIIVGPPGTGKSTTVWHIIHSRVARDARVLVTCIRNQAVDAVSQKVDSFGVLVFGSEARLGSHAKERTISGRMRTDVELLFWRQIVSTWTQTLRSLKSISWENLHRPAFPGFKRLEDVKARGVAALYDSSSSGKEKGRREQEKRAGEAAGRWIRALDHVMHDVYLNRLRHGSIPQRRTFKQIEALQKWKDLAKMGLERSERILARLEILTRYRILTKSKVLLCTVDSTERMLREIEEQTVRAAAAVGISCVDSPARVSLDTAILDEAACVLETTVPVILALGVNNLTLVGDQRQLQPFSMVRDSSDTNHSRSLMERALEAGYPSQFLDVQYRMHPRICQVISSHFYDGKLKTAPETELARRAPKALRWVHVSGDEQKHPGKGYSNKLEARVVAEQARLAVQSYGSSAEIFVITFYNKQRRRLEEEREKYPELKGIRIASVDSCQGSDADVVIISTVRSGGPGYRLSGFMLDRRRINVALSRAREECIVVGDKHTLSEGGGTLWNSIVDSFNA